MRILYIGLVDFSEFCLLEVLKNGGEVVGIVTSSDVDRNSDYRDLRPTAAEFGIPLHVCAKINRAETVDWIRARNPDILFCWGWSQLLQAELLRLAPMGVVGVHPSLLPQNRGRHPLIWALVLGLKESGLTFFFMDEGADSGPILSQRPFRIDDQDTATTLYQKIKNLAREQIAEFLPKLIDRTYQTVVQNSTLASSWRKRSAADGLIDWRMGKVSILNLVRALTKPYPGANFIYHQESVRVWSVQGFDGPVPENAEPGKVLGLANGKPLIRCGDGAVILKEWEPVLHFETGDYCL